jgi:hypothetical protein
MVPIQISDLLHAIRSRSDGQEGKWERDHLGLGFWRPVARLRPRWSTTTALRWSSSVGEVRTRCRSMRRGWERGRWCRFFPGASRRGDRSGSRQRWPAGVGAGIDLLQERSNWGCHRGRLNKIGREDAEREGGASSELTVASRCCRRQ